MKVKGIVTLCGSTKFKEDYERVNRELTMLGFVVISVGLFGHADKIKLLMHEKRLLDDLHLEKIRMSDAIYVINKDGYIGDSTRREIRYAKEHGKKVAFMEQAGYSDAL